MNWVHALISKILQRSCTLHIPKLEYSQVSRWDFVNRDHSFNQSQKGERERWTRCEEWRCSIIQETIKHCNHQQQKQYPFHHCSCKNWRQLHQFFKSTKPSHHTRTREHKWRIQPKSTQHPTSRKHDTLHRNISGFSFFRPFIASSSSHHQNQPK